MDQFHRDLLAITTDLNRGATLDQVLNRFYEGFKAHVPYDRIGVSAICDDEKTVRSVWARADYNEIFLGIGYHAPLAGSTLQGIMESGKPRILNDLEQYLQQHPGSHSTALILKEGVKSSLTCPLKAEGKMIGFLFFSKRKVNAYKDAHVEKFMQIAEHLSLVAARTIDLERLRLLNEMKNKFLGIAAHDLRSPLALVQSYIDMLDDDAVLEDKEKRQYLFGRAKATISRMLNLINDLLDISAIESGKLNLEMKPTDLSSFLQEIVSNHQITAKIKNIAVVGEIPDELPKVNIDTRRMAQAIDNLITNAVKFSPKGTTVKLKAEVEDGFVKISVIDQGQGIPEAEQAKLFQEFGKTSVRPTDGEKSTGLGLAIVKKIVVAHGGKVGVKSKEGIGSTFYLTIPEAK
ncbi:MAG: hypothetical protein Kow0029_32310 [Candidatus Rifleibacteriota bacterium]